MHISSHLPLPCTLLHIYMTIHHTLLHQTPLHLTLQKNKKKQDRKEIVRWVILRAALSLLWAPLLPYSHTEIRGKMWSCSPGCPAWAQPCPWAPFQAQVLLPRGSFAWLGERLWLNADPPHKQIQRNDVFIQPKFSSMFPWWGYHRIKPFSTEIVSSRSQKHSTGYSLCFSPATSFCFTLHKGPEELEELNHQNFSAWFSSPCHSQIVILQTKNKPNCV